MKKEDSPKKFPLTPTRTPRTQTGYNNMKSSTLLNEKEDRSPSHQLPTQGRTEGSLPSTMVQKQYWTIEEDERLKDLVSEYGAKNWKKIASMLGERTDVQCLHRWQKVLNPALVKGPWVTDISIKTM